MHFPRNANLREDQVARYFFLLASLLAPITAHGQSEAALKEYFEGRTVKVKSRCAG